MTDSREERVRLAEADRLIGDIAAKLQQNRLIIASSLGFGRISWRGKSGQWEIDLEPKL